MTSSRPPAVVSDAGNSPHRPSSQRVRHNGDPPRDALIDSIRPYSLAGPFVEYYAKCPGPSQQLVQHIALGQPICVRLRRRYGPTSRDDLAALMREG